MTGEENTRKSGRTGNRKGNSRRQFVKSEAVLELVQNWNKLSLDERMGFIQETNLWVVCSYQKQEARGRYALAPVASHSMFNRIVASIGATLSRIYTINERNTRGRLNLQLEDEEKLFQIISPFRIESAMKPAIDALDEVIKTCDSVLGYDRPEENRRNSERQRAVQVESPVEATATASDKLVESPVSDLSQE